ncbi:MAG: hypothetical protein K6U80_10550 [Firmicutes bacterium]|nr:hypothetical protein [Bacillota bacterium]
MIKQYRKWIAALMFISGLLAFTGGKLQAAQIKMTTSLGFGDFVIPGHWVPLRVQIKGGVDSARVEVIRYNEDENNPSREIFAVSNPAAGASQLEIPVLASFKVKRVVTRLYHGKQLLTEQSLNLSGKIFPGHLILAINLPAAEQQAIQKSLLPDEPVLAVPIQPEELPGSGLNYDGVSGVVINNPGLVLAPAQIKTLRSWLTGGGRLVIVAASQQPPNWVRRLAGGNWNLQPKGYQEVFPVGFGSLIIIHPKSDAAGILQFSGEWRKILNLKPYLQSLRISAGQCFPGPVTVKPGQKFSLINPLSLFFLLWVGAAVFLNLYQKKKPPLNRFLILTLFSVAAAVPLAGILAKLWKHGAAWHTQAVILPDGGGALVCANIGLYPSNESGVYGSPWGVTVTGPSDEEGGINFETDRESGRRMAFWRRQHTPSQYSLSAGGSNNLVLTGCFPEFRVNQTRSPSNTPDTPDPWLPQLLIPNETVSWDGRQWRLLINYSLNGPLWREISGPPQWFQDGVELMKRCQALFADTLWLGGRNRLPRHLCLKIQGSPIPEYFWVMPAPF